MRFEKFNDNKEKIEISDNVKTQLENLGLTTDDIKGKILDIGANDGQLAKELKGVSDAEVISIDNRKDEGVSENVMIADARELPFENGSFDRVVSHASIPNVFLGIYSEEFPELSKREIKKSISKTFREMLRVLKSGSSATLAPVRIAKNYESERVLSNTLQEEIQKLQEEGIQVTFELIREEENPNNKEKGSFYRLSILKK
ncbi:MAG: class I SAM-dependent methyltransferase [Candidatus Paceibacterota bacterium]